MNIPEGDSFKEIMELLRKRNKICVEWMERIEKEVQEGVISFEEYKSQMHFIRSEIAKTEEVRKRQEEYLKKVKIIKK